MQARQDPISPLRALSTFVKTVLDVFGAELDPNDNNNHGSKKKVRLSLGSDLLNILVFVTIRLKIT